MEFLKDSHHRAVFDQTYLTSHIQCGDWFPITYRYLVIVNSTFQLKKLCARSSPHLFAPFMLLASSVDSFVCSVLPQAQITACIPHFHFLEQLSSFESRSVPRWRTSMSAQHCSRSQATPWSMPAQSLWSLHKHKVSASDFFIPATRSLNNENLKVCKKIT